MTLSQLVFEIEIAKQRLHHAVSTGNDSLAFETSKQLANLNNWFFNHMKKEIKMERSAVYFLVFSEEHVDGVVLSQVEYRNLCRRMTKQDRETHVAVEVDGPLVEATEQQLFLVAAAEKSQKESA
jgi:hypothetical protein